jgi:DNA-binding response OmpR family regulator
MNKKILVVDDDNLLTEALVLALEKAGFKTKVAVNGKEGLLAVKDFKPDLILLDILMPVMDGMTMLEDLRNEEEFKHLPVILLTNANDEEQVSYALQNGAMDYLVKSEWKLVDVVAKVKEKLAAIN